jgi:hypothetical protein
LKSVALFAIAAGLGLAGCTQTRPTLEQAQAQCEKTGGFLTVIYTQEITMAGLSPEVAKPGDCIPASKFEPGTAPPADGKPAAEKSAN